MNKSPVNELEMGIVKELVSKLPVEAIYRDGVAPSIVQTGSILSDLLKTVHLALAPFQLLGAYQDRLRNFIDNSVRRVPEEKRVPPAVQILGPIIEGIRYEPEGTPIDQMFSNLLSCSMNQDHVQEAHPSYPIIIKQLSADEAKILHNLYDRTFDYIYTRAYNHNNNTFYGPNTVEKDDLPKEDLQFPANVLFYLEHLTHLGLAGIFQTRNQEPILEGEPRVQVGIRAFNHYRLNDFGRRFVAACNGFNNTTSS
jgi:hypothetical protein